MTVGSPNREAFRSRFVHFRFFRGSMSLCEAFLCKVETGAIVCSVIAPGSEFFIGLQPISKSRTCSVSDPVWLVLTHEP
jgi:hypothetical protein